MFRFAAWVDNLLNSFTMYRLVLYGVIALAAASIAYSFFGNFAFSPIDLILSLTVLLAASVATNFIFSKFFNAPVNLESTYITALILFFVMLPAQNLNDFGVLAAAAFLANASKYILAINRKHIFNPVAIAALIIGISGIGFALWWVATPFLIIPTTIIGLLIVRKIRRFRLFLTFVVTALITMLIFGIKNGNEPLEILNVAILSYPVIFFGTIMLTEPQTTPPTKKLQLIYGALVGILFGSQYHFGPFTSSPEMALVIGNIFSYAVSSKKLFLKLEEKREIARDTYEFVFSGINNFKFTAGQYLEWTLPNVPIDIRGNRRFFTIASAPTDETIKLGVKMNQNSSAFKKKLLESNPGMQIIASQLSGDFTLSNSPNEKLVFIAGGIGITPFISILSDLLNKKERRDIVLFYSNKTQDEIAYKELLEWAEKELGIKTVYIVSEKTENWKGESGHIDGTMIKKYVTEFEKRTYYLSGPNSMVHAYKELLAKLGIKLTKIHTDYFPGF